LPQAGTKSVSESGSVVPADVAAALSWSTMVLGSHVLNVC